MFLAFKTKKARSGQSLGTSADSLRRRVFVQLCGEAMRLHSRTSPHEDAELNKARLGVLRRIQFAMCMQIQLLMSFHRLNA
jgi:hypothetical protein